jgi:hypothetical protein
MTALFNGPVPASLGRFDLPQRVLGKATSRLPVRPVPRLDQGPRSCQDRHAAGAQREIE